MRVPVRRLQSVIVALRSGSVSLTESIHEKLEVNAYVRRYSDRAVGVKRARGGASLRDIYSRDDWRSVRLFSTRSSMNVAMPDEEVLVERLDGNGVEVDAAEVFDNRVVVNGAAAEGAAPMAVEGGPRVGLHLVNGEAPANLHMRLNLAVDPPAELAEMVIGEERLDESAPTTPDCAEERVDLSGLHSRNFDLQFSGGNGSASKRMRVESPIHSHVYDLKEKHIAAAWEHWTRLGSPRLHVAPMVDQSELPFRMLCRKYGATAAYTPMLHSRLYVQDHKYRKEFTTCSEDRPLFVQFCANNPDTLLEAGRLVESDCDYVDLNLGCPQRIAKRGNYGAFLMDNLPLVEALVKKLSSNLTTPVSCKIRLFPDIRDTLAYARMLEDAGCSLLAVHGRTRDQKNGKHIRADWEAIKQVREALRIPVLANGNIRWLEDVETCLAATGVEGVLSAESILENPALFGGYRSLAEVLDVGAGANADGHQSLGTSGSQTYSQKTVDERVLCQEYLDLCETYPVPMRMVRGHVHKMLGNYWFRQHPHFREELNKQFKLNLEWLKDLLQRMMALPPPGTVPASIPVGQIRTVENGAMNGVHDAEPSPVNRADAGTVSVPEMSTVGVNLAERVSVQ